MNATTNHDAWRELTGSYVLDALPESERAEFEAHLRTCDTCAAEVRDLRETVAELGATYETPAPAGAEERLIRTIREQRADVPAATTVASLAEVRRSPRTATYFLAAASVLLAMALGVVGFTAYSANQRSTAAESVLKLATMPDAHLMPLPIPSASSSLVVSEVKNEAAVLASSMPMPAAGHVYQVWTKNSAGTMTSVGMFVPSKKGTVAQMLVADVRTTKVFMITVEPAGGSTQPTQAPIAEVSL
jgi:anti-sigma-K factor RskA